MMSMVLQVFLLIGLGIAQISFLSTWPAPVNTVDVLLSLVIFITVLISYHRGLWWGFGAGVFLELFSSLPFGVTTLSMLFMVIMVNFLFKNFFTNRSFYSLLLLGYFGTACFNACSLGLHFLTVVILPSVQGLPTIDFALLFFWEPVFNLVVLGVIFFTYHVSMGRFKSIFLLTHDSHEAYRTHR